ncbi:hypothetical protein JCM39194_21980 [Desulfotomaculum varum]
MKFSKWPLLLCLLLSIVCAVPAAAAQQVAPGIRQWSFERTNWDGKPVRGYVLEVNPLQKNTEIRVVPGNEVLASKETLSSMAERTGAVAAVNGGFFDMVSGLPVGNLFIDGQAEYISDILRTSLAFAYDGSVKMGYLNPKLSVEVAGLGRLAVQGVNLPAPGDGLVLYSRAYGQAAPGDARVSLVPAGGGLFLVQPFGGSLPPAGGYVLSGWGVAASQVMSLPAGAKAKVITELPAGWGNLRHALSAGPLLVEGGLPVEQALQEGLWGQLLKPAPRTALGVTAQGKVLLVVVDGRQESSAGLTLEELSYLMIDLGARRAVAMDGGGSSEMWVKGKILNSPSDQKERPLANGLLIIQQMPVYVDRQRLYLDVAPVIEQGRTLVPMRKIFERLGAAVAWDEASKTVTAVKEDCTIKLTVGQTTVLVNDKKVKLDVPAKVINGRTMVPMRFVSEALGARVNYQAAPVQAVYIESPEGGNGNGQ